MSKKSRTARTFRGEVTKESSGGLFGLASMRPDSVLFKRMGKYFAKESERWKRIKGK